jgi:hypothetical protein
LEQAVTGLVLLGKLKPESPMTFMGKSDGFWLRCSQQNQSIEIRGENMRRSPYHHEYFSDLHWVHSNRVIGV